MARVPSVRASDSDREHAAERLRHATGEGRLTPDELEQRLEALYRARTYGELDVLVADLPAETAPVVAHGRGLGWLGAAGLVTLFLAVLGMLTSAARHPSVAVDAFPRHPGRFGFGGPFAAGAHHMMVTAGSMIAVVLVVAAVCGALIWFLLRSDGPAA